MVGVVAELFIDIAFTWTIGYAVYWVLRFKDELLKIHDELNAQRERLDSIAKALNEVCCDYYSDEK